MSLQSFTYGVPLVVEPVVEKSPIKSPQKRPRVASIKDSDNNVEQVLNEVSASNPSTPSKTGKRNIYFLDSDTTDRAKNANKRAADFLNYLANEPSVGIHHVNSHVHRSVHKMVQIKKELKKHSQLQDDIAYDMDQTISTVRGYHDINSFQSLRDLVVYSLQVCDSIEKREPISNPRSLSTGSSTAQSTSSTSVPSTPEKNRTPKDRTPAQSGEFPAAAMVVAQSADEKQNGHENGTSTPLNHSGNIVDSNKKEETSTTPRNEASNAASEPQLPVTPQKKTLQINQENNERKTPKKKPVKDNSALELKPKTF
jgi:hypothetical protein